MKKIEQPQESAFQALFTMIHAWAAFWHTAAALYHWQRLNAGRRRAPSSGAVPPRRAPLSIADEVEEWLRHEQPL